VRETQGSKRTAGTVLFFFTATAVVFTATAVIFTATAVIITATAICEPTFGRI